MPKFNITRRALISLLFLNKEFSMILQRKKMDNQT